MDILERIREFLQQRLGVDPARVVPEATLAELGVDSLLMLDLVFEMEEQLGVSLGREAGNPKTVGELMAILARLQANVDRA